jgi:hypothetical protein
MTATKSLPARPSLESLRKQAKKLSREISAGNAAARARARAQLPDTALPLSLRDAQLVIAREYGYVGWRELTTEVLQRVGKGLEWAVSRAKERIHANDVAALEQLLEEFPALLTWGAQEGGLLGFATSSYGNSFDPEREQKFTRHECAELLIDAGAVVAPAVVEGLLNPRSRGMLRLYETKRLLPATLKFFVALGNLERVRACFDANGRSIVSRELEDMLAAVNEAFIVAYRFEHETIAAFLLERYIELDPRLSEQIDGGPGRADFLRYLLTEKSLEFMNVAPETPWQSFRMHQVVSALMSEDLGAFCDLLRHESWLLEERCIKFQVGLIERATLRNLPTFIEKFLDFAPALLRQQPPPRSQAIEFALVYTEPQVIPLLTRIWPLPDDLPTVAGIGSFEQVRRWFDSSTAQPASQWQSTVDTAFAYAVLNHHFEIAAFLLERGADVNTRWGSHEPASVLHELVLRDDYEGMEFLIDRGIDMTIRDYRWGATAEGWARHAARNGKMGDWLANAERHRAVNGGVVPSGSRPTRDRRQ